MKIAERKKFNETQKLNDTYLEAKVLESENECR